MPAKGKGIWAGIVFLLLLLGTVPISGAANGIEGLTQNGAESGKISLTWEQPGECNSYEVYASFHGKEAYTLRKSLFSEQEKVKTEITVSLGGKYYDIRLAAFDREGNLAAEETLSKCVTLTSEITGIQQQSQYTQGRMKLSWDRQEAASGYEIETYLYSQKKKSYYNVRSVYATIPMNQDQLYRIRIRGYVTLSVNGKIKKLYGPYGTVYTALQPRLSFEGGDEHSITVHWKTVEGAESYAVFLSRSQKSGYQRVAITYAPTAVIKNLEPNTRYYVLVRTNKRVNGILYRSPATYTYPVRICTNGTGTASGFVLEK